MKDTFVYIIGMSNDMFCKVGIARNPHERARGIQTGNPYRVEVGAMFGPFDRNMAAKIERTCHIIMAESGACGEWFFVSQNTARAVIQNAITIASSRNWRGGAEAAADAFIAWMAGRAA